MSTSITKIACGRSHVLALDAKGIVWSWGTNDKGQLGHSNDTLEIKDRSVKDTPKKITKLKDIVQIYCGELSSFAVDQYGDIFAWGFNQNNSLLINTPDHKKVISPEPMLVKLPSFFQSTKNQQIVQNTNMGYDFFSSCKPVKSESSKT